ncbi:hypothetical protein LF41_1150 [Lysobacter dokdonensis DS-58]|uniref:Uncharacterized protein n=1 Tax=Lysobacter dokdonensis DS-58 TaxID=1300345 RepID=A0A0A2WLE8_9GAMM|nr:hypothetical protein [Lysobacter dokdonensis]KGQ20613.1 hypothetical protein LF41_1150 [Lysobacter dokdonensis DS-58]
MSRPTLEKLEDVTIERMLAVRAVRACDGYISRLLWEHPASSSTVELLISVQEISEEFVAPVRKRVSQLLIESQQVHNVKAEVPP